MPPLLLRLKNSSDGISSLKIIAVVFILYYSNLIQFALDKSQRINIIIIIIVTKKSRISLLIELHAFNRTHTISAILNLFFILAT